MKTPDTPFTEIYLRWLDSLRSLIPGGAGNPPADMPTPKQEEVAAKQEWEHEGGSLNPPPQAPGAESAPKLPL